MNNFNNTYHQDMEYKLRCDTQDWKRCQALCNTIELNKRIRGFNLKTVTKESAKKAKNMLDPIRLEEVQQISEGATCFYLWVSHLDQLGRHLLVFVG